MGRVSRKVTEARRRQLQDLLDRNTYLPIDQLCRRLGVSEATARRDLADLERRNLLRRTRGGALSPYAGALGDFEQFFPTFDQRASVARDAKRAIADAALTLLRPGLSIFLDSGTTCFALAERIESTRAGNLVVHTHNLAVAVKLSPVPGVEVRVLGGTLLPRQAGLFGDDTCRAISGAQPDIAFVGGEGMDARGLWNSQKDVVRLQRAALAAATKKVALLDSGKAGVRGPVHLAPWSMIDLLVTDADRRALAAADIALPPERVLTARPDTKEARHK
jgi:DeoR/GlpR family transcriptional regulator of sugar metabolism